MRYTILILAIVLSIFGYYAYWSWLADQIRVSVDQWIEEQESKGISITHGSFKTHGFPYRVQTTIQDVSIRHQPEGQEQTELKVTQIDGWVMPYSLKKIVLQLNGPQTLTIGRPGKSPLILNLSEEDARSSIVVEDEQTARIAVDIKGLLVNSTEWNAPATINRLQLHTRRPDINTQDLFLKLESVDLGRSDVGLGRLIALAQAHISFPEPKPKNFSREEIEAWRLSGGTVELQRLDIQWNGVTTQANGTLALDDSARPIGSLIAKIDGHEHLINYFQSNGALTGNGARIANASLDLMKAAAGELSVPLNLQDGKITLGPAELGEVPALY